MVGASYAEDTFIGAGVLESSRDSVGGWFKRRMNCIGRLGWDDFKLEGG